MPPHKQSAKVNETRRRAVVRMVMTCPLPEMRSTKVHWNESHYTASTSHCGVGQVLAIWRIVCADFAPEESAEPPRLQVSLWDSYNASLILEQRRYNMSL